MTSNSAMHRTQIELLQKTTEEVNFHPLGIMEYSKAGSICSNLKTMSKLAKLRISFGCLEKPRYNLDAHLDVPIHLGLMYPFLGITDQAGLLTIKLSLLVHVTSSTVHNSSLGIPASINNANILSISVRQS